MEAKTRNTKQRKLIIDCFTENKLKHLTVDEIFERVKQRDSKIGIATVYRNVRCLHQQGLIKRVQLPNATTCYEMSFNMDTHTHHHLVCQECEQIFDFDQDLLEKVERQIEETKNFIITDHRVVFYGICKGCKQNSNISD